MLKVAIIGAGSVGTAMGYLLKHRGYPVIGAASRTTESAKKAVEFIGEGEATTDLKAIAKKSEIVFITTPDGVIEEVCRKLALENGFNPGTVVLHMSGALSSEILKSAKAVGANVASLHPLQSFANVKEAVKNLPGSYFCMEGDKAALPVAREIVSVLNGKELTLKVDKKPLYHAGAAVASNFLVATVEFGLELLEAAGIDRQDSLDSLMPLIKGTINNIENLGIPSALTGPISRGDIGVIEDHLKTILRDKPERLRLYTELGRYTVEIAVKKGTINDNDAERIISLLDKYQKRLPSP
jgi:predicted short-subunit dehydrogenase-like oxidoreductase (DUF2520 family)